MHRLSTPMKIDKRRRFTVGAAVIVVVALVWYWLAIALRPPAQVKGPSAVPVDMVTVQRADVPVYLEGLGTVQAFYTVTITPRVDGQIEKVAFAEGQEVKQGTLLVQIDPRPYQAALDQALGTAAKDAAQLANAQRDLDRYVLLAPEELASKQTVDTQRALVAQLQAQIKADQANIDSARTQLTYTTITSPISGRTGIRLVDPGNIVHAADTTGIVVVTQLQPISVIFSLPEDALGEVGDALSRGRVTATALSRNHREELDRGTVALIDNQIDQATGTIRVKATFPNALHKLWPGEFVNVQVLTEVKRQVLTIPASALQRGPDGAFAYVVQADSTVLPVSLTIGNQTGDVVIVDRGLTAGQRVVSSNQYRLQPKALVRANVAVAGPGKPPTDNAS